MKFIPLSAVAPLLAHRFGNDAQNHAHASHAFASVVAGLNDLKKLGYADLGVGLVEPDDDQREPVQWPKMMYHDEHAPTGRVAHSQSHADNFYGDGWRDRPMAVEPPPGEDVHMSEVAQRGVAARPTGVSSDDLGPMIGLPHRPKQQFDDTAANEARLENNAGASQASVKSGDDD